MYYNLLAEQDLGFDAFIAPDDFNRTAQPVDIYEVFKREYVLNSQARYIYYYSDGNYPLTLTPTASEYYRYGYTQGGSDIVVDVALNAAPVTIFGETLTTRRWVIVYRVSTAKFSLIFQVINALWVYCGDKVNEIRASLDNPNNTIFLRLKYIHFANLNSITGDFYVAFYSSGTTVAPLTGTLALPETVLNIREAAFRHTGGLISKVNAPNTKDIAFSHNLTYPFIDRTGIVEFNFGASTYLGLTEAEFNAYTNLSRVSVSFQNASYVTFENCDIVYTKDLLTVYRIAPKTVRGLTLPDQLPQAQITALGTKLSANIMQGYQLYIGTQITDLTNLYLSNKSFSTIGVGVGNTVFSAENGMLRTATNLIKAGTSNTGDLIIPNVTTIESNCFLRCTGYTGNLTIPNTVTTIVANSFNGLSGLTGSLVIGSGLTTIPANAFAGLSGLTGNLTIPNTVTSIAAGAFSGLTNLTSLTLPVGYDCAIYNNFGFANFTAASLNTAIQNLASGTVGTPKYFNISKTSFDALNVAYPNAVSDAAARFINVTSATLLYKFEGNTNDLSRNGLDGTLVGGATINNNRLNVTANGQYLSTADSDLLSFGSGAFSFSFRVLVTSFAAYNWIINKRDDGSIINNARSEWQVEFENGKLSVFLIDSSNTSASYIYATTVQTFSANIEYKIQITYSGGVGNYFKIYVNGSLVSHKYTTAGTYTQMRNTTARLLTGIDGWSYTMPLKGYIDNLYIFKGYELQQNDCIALNNE